MSTKPGRAGFTRQQIVADTTRPTRPTEEDSLWLDENEPEQGLMSFTPNATERRTTMKTRHETTTETGNRPYALYTMGTRRNNRPRIVRPLAAAIASAVAVCAWSESASASFISYGTNGPGGANDYHIDFSWVRGNDAVDDNLAFLNTPPGT
jgi:hypothetical protein